MRRSAKVAPAKSSGRFSGFKKMASSGMKKASKVASSTVDVAKKGAKVGGEVANIGGKMATSLIEFNDKVAEKSIDLTDKGKFYIETLTCWIKMDRENVGSTCF